MSRLMSVVRSGWVMVPGNLKCPGILPFRILVEEGPTVCLLCVRVGCTDIFFSPLSFSSLERRQVYKLKYCLKRPLNPNQPTTAYAQNSPMKYRWFLLFLLGQQTSTKEFQPL